MATAEQRAHNIKEFERLQNEIAIQQVPIAPAAAVLLQPGPPPQHPGPIPAPQVWLKTATQALDALPDTPVLMLVFGSAHRPGGGVLTGAIAQEEDLSRQTTWHFHAKDCPQFYDMTHANALYSDWAVYAPSAWQLINAAGAPIAARPVSMIGAAAPNLKQLVVQGQAADHDRIDDVLLHRVRGLLDFAEQEAHTTLLLGAWGCGVFGLDPERVARVFKTALDEGRFSGRTIFSIPDPVLHHLFSKTLAAKAPRLK